MTCRYTSFRLRRTALAFGLLAVLIGMGLTPGLWSTLYLAALLLLGALTMFNRGRRIVAEAKP